MSLRALTWALEHPRCPSPAAKLVLVVFANFVDADGCAWPAATTVAEMTKLDIKTVRAAIDALEDDGCNLIEDTGQRKGRTGQVKVYRLLMESPPETDGLETRRAGEPPRRPQRASSNRRTGSRPKADTLKAPVFPAKGSQKRETEPVTGTDTPNEPDGSLPPSGGRRGGRSRISDAWAAPAIADLPPNARAVAEQWPGGSYAARAEAFRTGAIGNGRTARDWTAMWCAKVIEIGAQPLRDARAGLKHPAAAPPSAPAIDPAAAASTLEERARRLDRIGRADDAARCRADARRVRTTTTGAAR